MYGKQLINEPNIPPCEDRRNAGIYDGDVRRVFRTTLITDGGSGNWRKGESRNIEGGRCAGRGIGDYARGLWSMVLTAAVSIYFLKLSAYRYSFGVRDFGWKFKV